MKFVAKHRSNILTTLKHQQIEESEVDFVKKRGRIQVIHRVSGRKFSYLRIKETKLDPHTHHWKNSESYKIKINELKEAPVGNWEMVMKAFDKWTKSVKD